MCAVPCRRCRIARAILHSARARVVVVVVVVHHTIHISARRGATQDTTGRMFVGSGGPPRREPHRCCQSHSGVPCHQCSVPSHRADFRVRRRLAGRRVLPEARQRGEAACLSRARASPRLLLGARFLVAHQTSFSNWLVRARRWWEIKSAKQNPILVRDKTNSHFPYFKFAEMVKANAKSLTDRVATYNI